MLAVSSPLCHLHDPFAQCSLAGAAVRAQVALDADRDTVIVEVEHPDRVLEAQRTRGRSSVQGDCVFVFFEELLALLGFGGPSRLKAHVVHDHWVALEGLDKIGHVHVALLLGQAETWEA
jgi:hypothetical protein